MKQPTSASIKDVVIPIAGIGLAFLLAFQPGERWSLVFLAISMMGVPWAIGRDRQQRAKRAAQDEERVRSDDTSF